MKKVRSRQIVVDASVVRSAGTTEHPISKACRNTLFEILTICHRVVVTDDILNEWKKHRSKYATTWIASMYARKKIIHLDALDDQELDEKLKNCPLDEKTKLALQKDLHLIKAALATDELIISSDETLRSLLKIFALQAGVIKSILYVNPTLEQDRVIEWLRDGAVVEKERQIGNIPE